MKRFEGYMAGANLGHWISQYGTKSHEHFSTYITEPDIKRISEWKMDHVRVPVDYFIFEDDANPGVYKPDGLVYIDNCLAWCKKYGVNMIIDLHHAPGFFFGNGDKNCLFSDVTMQERYINIWKFFSERYIDEGDNLVFELLNELVVKDVSPWNELWVRTAAAIHAINPNRRIIVGGNYYNAVTELKNLVISDNPNIIYTFHMYHPMQFTHQHAGWVDRLKDYDKKVEYPVIAADHPFLFGEKYKGPAIMGKEYLRGIIAPAIEFIEKYDRPLYCGEYGVISNASLESAMRWYLDASSLFLEYGIGRAVWSYRGFSMLTDRDNNVVNGALINILSKK